MKEYLISTKANTLSDLRGIVKQSYIEDIYIVYADRFYTEPDTVIEEIQEQFSDVKIVCRSSSKSEDNMQTSNAGHFESVLDVEASDKEAVFHAISRVYQSYVEGEETEEKRARLMDEREQVLVQKQTGEVRLSGVVFTRDIIYNRPYYMITYDDNGSTDSVTSGEGGRTKWIAKNASIEFLNYDFAHLLKAVQEIEQIYEYVSALDIEFAILQDGKVVIFQVRPLAAALNIIAPMTDREFKDTKAFAKCMYLDNFHILSDMAFWNPAEIIGSNPRPLDYSLYRELITAHIWSAGLQPLGYQAVRGELMQKVGNKPYISVNYTFEGLTPAGLPEDLCYKLYQYYQEKLKADKTAHDKIEFEIIFNTYDFMTDDRLKELAEHGFSSTEIWQLRNALFDIAKQTLLHYDEICEEDLRSLEQMTKLRHELRSHAPLSESNVMKLYSYIDELLTSIKDHGTPQFTRQARCAFMARSFCRTLVEKGYFTQQEMDDFMLGIPTVASEFERDFDLYSHGKMNRDEFNHLYGHLRLGTYDIRSDSYRNIYFDVATSKLSGNEKQKREAKTLSEDRLAVALDAAGIKCTPVQFMDFIRRATQNREYFKFEFTKSLSLMLDVIVRLGEVMAIAREDMSYLEIQDLLSYHSRDSYIQIIEGRRKMYHANSYLVLPEVIFDVGDIDVIDIDEARPNFITNKTVEAHVVNLDEKHDSDITGKIVVLTKADPGYDWIFAKGIAGFVTKYGGAASHMAIRCAEFGIPAAIGCGEKIFQRIKRMTVMHLDCEHGRILEKNEQELI